MIQDILEKSILILGCGNTLFGDDGFGPEVIGHLESNFSLPENVWVQDMGTGIRDFLFDLMISPTKPKRIFILDTICQPGRQAGELFEIDLTQFPGEKTTISPFHQFPSIHQLQELESLAGVDIRILAVQAKEVPDSVSPGLSTEVKEAVPRACDWLVKEISSGSLPL